MYKINVYVLFFLIWNLGLSFVIQLCLASHIIIQVAFSSSTRRAFAITLDMSVHYLLPRIHFLKWWHFSEIPLVTHWHSVVYHWISNGMSLAFEWYILQVFHWHTNDKPLTYHWYANGMPLSFNWYSIGMLMKYLWHLPLICHLNTSGMPLFCRIYHQTCYLWICAKSNILNQVTLKSC